MHYIVLVLWASTYISGYETLRLLHFLLIDDIKMLGSDWMLLVHSLKYCIMYSFEVIVLIFCYFKIPLRQQCYAFSFTFDKETFCNLTVPLTFPLRSFIVKNKTKKPPNISLQWMMKYFEQMCVKHIF